MNQPQQTSIQGRLLYRPRPAMLSIALCAFLGACGGGGFSQPDRTAITPEPLSVDIQGLSVAGLVLQNNGAEALSVDRDGRYVFSQSVVGNGAYSITVATQPVGQTCTVNGGAGTGVIGPIATIRITCSTNAYPVSGAVVGLAAGESVTLNNNGADSLTINADGNFAFATPVAFNSSYAVTVAAQPTGRVCSVSNGVGSGVTRPISNVAITCSAITYGISGSVSGLTTGSQVTLNNNGADPLTVSANGAFAFATPVAFNGSYAVTIGTQPTGQICSVGNATGNGVTAAVSSVSVVCSTPTYPLSVTVSGLAAGRQVTLRNNAADPLNVTANGGATFATPVAANGSYSVTIGTQPVGQVCSVAGGSGSNVVASIPAIAVTCVTSGFTVSGTISGLATGAQTTLLNQGGDALVVSANGAFTFPTSIAAGGSYAVTVGTNPTGGTCTVSNRRAGSNLQANATNVEVMCSSATFTIGGTITGIPAGQQVTLRNNGADDLIVTADGAFTFATPVVSNSAYSVNVATQPTGASCVVSRNSGSGIAVSSNITSVSIACGAQSSAMSLLRLSQNQLADAQWNVSACLTTSTCQIFSSTPGVQFRTPFSVGQFNWGTCGADAYMAFTPNMVGGVRDTTNPWSQDLYFANGTVCTAGGVGNFRIAGFDANNNFYLFYVGSDNNTGTLVTANTILGSSGFSFTGTSNPTISEVNQFVSGL